MNTEYEDKIRKFLMMDDAEFLIQYLNDMDLEELRTFTEKCPDFMEDLSYDETMAALKNTVYENIRKELGL